MVKTAKLNPLLEAATRGDADEIRALLAAGASAESKDADSGRSALSFAAASGRLDAVVALLESGAAVDAKDVKDERTPLTYAASGPVAAELIRRGADVNAKDERQYTPLMAAAENGRVDVVEELLKHGADLEAKQQYCKWMPLRYATKNGHAAVVAKLLEGGATPTVEDLVEAAQYGRSEIIFQFLDTAGLDVNAGNSWGQAALANAAWHGHLELVKQLIGRGARVDGVDGFMRTALSYTAATRYADVVKELLRSGADVNARDREGKSALSWAATARPMMLDILQALIEHGADADSNADDGRTPLASAAEKQLTDSVEGILRLAAFDPSDCPSERVALFVAAVMGDRDAITKLLADGLSVDERTKHGRTPLFYAAQCGQAHVVQLLLERGAAVDAKAPVSPSTKSSQASEATQSAQTSREWETALTLAGRAGHLQICQALIEAGAPVNVRGASGETLLTSAARWNFFPAVQLAVAFGGAVRFEQVREDEHPLIPGTLETMRRLCSDIAFEFNAVSLRLQERLESVLAQIQEFDETRFRVFEADSLVSFATIIFRFCSVLYQIDRRPDLLSRFIGSRTILGKIEDMHEELDHFVKLLGLTNSGGADATVDSGSAGGGTVGGWRAQMVADLLSLFPRFEAALSTTEALMNGYMYPSKRSEALLHLQYERKMWAAEGNAVAQELVDGTLQRFLAACNREAPPSLPEWFISRDDVEFHSWNLVKKDKGLHYHEGKWRKTTVTVETGMFNTLERDVPQWFKASHPNVIKLFGACHSNMYKILVYELVPEAKPLHEFLDGLQGDRATAWKCLHDAALGLQYLHTREIVHGDLKSENILVGPDLTTKLCGLREHPHPSASDGRRGEVWMSPEILKARNSYGDDDVVKKSFAADIYALGMCIWEAITHELPWKGVGGTTIIKQKENGLLPSRPAAIGDDEWELITKMCAANPDERVKIAFVVNRLKQFLYESGHVGDGESLTMASGSGDEAAESMSASTKTQRQSVDEYVFTELEGTTIPKTLSLIQVRSAKLSDEQWIASKVYPALEFIFALMKEQRKSASDLEVVQFCVALARLQRYLRTAVSEKSVFLLARSRQVAAANFVVYAELDRLLDSLGVSETDPIRVWRHDVSGSAIGRSTGARPSELEKAVPVVESTDASTTSTSSSTSSSDNTGASSAPNSRRVTESSSPVALNHFDSPSANHAQWTRDGLAATAAATGTTPSWHLALRDLVFSEADKIGQGAFGAVYKGSWLDTPVVVKFMGYEEDIGMISTDLLLHEVRVWHRLSHPHVLKLYGANHTDKRYFVCELASNGDLLEYLKQPGNEQLKWQKLHEAALGLEYLHGRNVAHNDLKCDNIMVGMDGKAKLIDFGLSALLHEAEIQIDVKRMGAVHWRSPEYLSGGRPSCASDVYSFAMCIIECVSGEIPWGKSMVPAMVKLKVKKGLTPKLPESLMSEKQRNLVELMTQLDPAERVKMGFVVDKLSEFAQDEKAAKAP